jgi:hypothetical protein
MCHAHGSKPRHHHKDEHSFHGFSSFGQALNRVRREKRAIMQ